VHTIDPEEVHREWRFDDGADLSHLGVGCPTTGILTLPDAGGWAADAKVGQISSIIETPFAMYLFRVDSVHQAGIPTFADAKDTVTEILRDQKKTAEAKRLGQELIKQVNGGATLPQAAAALKLPQQVYGPFTRLNSPLHDAAVTGAAFGLPAGKHSDVIDTKGGLYVLQVLEHTNPDSAAFVKNLNDVRARANQDARQERVQTYLAGLRSTAKIVDNRSKVLQQRGQTGS